MFERFTERARRIVTLAQEEAKRLDHNYVGTEHILLGLISEGEGVAAKVLASTGISLDAARQQVEEIIGRGQVTPSGHIPFTPRAKKVLELSLRESMQLGHNYIGTEHILLGLIREGDGVAAQVLVRLGADQDLLRQRVVLLLHGHQIEESGPDTSDLDAQIEAARIEKEAAVGARDFEQAASRRNQEQQLLTEKAARQELWAAGHPARPDLAEQCRQLIDEVERLRSLLRQHGIDPEDEPA
jgi:hypothetical protein